MKQCSKCKQWLPISEFHKDGTRKDSLEHRCKQCRKIDYWGYKERIKNYGRIYQQTHKKQTNKYLRNKRKTDLKYNLNCKVRKTIWKSLRGSKDGNKWQDLFVETSIGKSITSSNSEFAEHSRKYLMSFYQNSIELEDILLKAGAEFTDKENCDVDLSPENIEKDTILNLLL